MSRMAGDGYGQVYYYDPNRDSYFPVEILVTGPSQETAPTTNWPEYLDMLDEPEPDEDDEYEWESSFHYMYGRDE